MKTIFAKIIIAFILLMPTALSVDAESEYRLNNFIFSIS